MRKILLIILIAQFTCSGIFAQNWTNLFGRKPATPSVNNSKEVQAILQSLAPSEAEAQAIARLRAKIQSPEQVTADVPPTEQPDACFAIEFRYISVQSPLAEMIIGEPAMNWSILVNTPERNDSLVEIDRTTPGRGHSAVYTEVPLLVRFLDDTNVANMVRLYQSQRMADLMDAPQFVVRSGQSGMVNDTTQVPICEGVHPVIADWHTSYQPVIRYVPQGQRIEVQGIVLQDNSVRLEKCFANFTVIENVGTTKILDDGKSGVTVQVPVVKSLQVSIPEMVVPSGMSLMMALPGIEHPRREGGTLFLLVTPRAFYPERQPVEATNRYGAPYNYPR